MRISDWSSDVCSSDLGALRVPDMPPIPDLAALSEVMRRLRDPVDGCPWDAKQDFASIAPYTIEEAYEVADAIDRNDLTALRSEEHTSELQSLMRISYAGFCLKKKTYRTETKKT